MKNSKEALALREKRNSDIKAAFNELLKVNDEQNRQKWSFTQIYLILSDRFYLLPRQIQRIIHGK
jgi:hypothetical protein